jgi:hypothetical protein
MQEPEHVTTTEPQCKWALKKGKKQKKKINFILFGSFSDS